MVIVGVLIGLITFLSFVLVWIMFPPIMDFVRRKMPVSQKRIDRRYLTIDGWLISKRVQPHDDCCNMLIKQLAEEPERYYKKGCNTTTTSSSDTSSATNSSCSNGSSCSCKKNPPPPAKPGKPYTFDPTNMLNKLASIHWEKEDLDKLKGDDDKNGDEEDPESQLDEEPEGSLPDDEDHSVSTDGDDFCNGEDIMNKKCAICLEKFRVGEAVSWSCDETCQHVFHHECLRNWLLRRVQCPCCRTIVLPIDKPKLKLQSSKRPRKLFGREKFTPEEMKEMAAARSKYLTRTYFCVEKGLVLLRPIREKEEDKDKSSANETEKTVKEEDEDTSSDNTPPSETKRGFRFWRRNKNQANNTAAAAAAGANNVLNTTGSMCSDDSFGDVDSEDGHGATPCQLDRRSTCGTVRMGSGCSIECSRCDEDLDLEAAADSSTYDASETTEQGFSTSYRTSDDEYGQSYRSEHELSCSCRTSEDEAGRGLSSSCRTSDDEYAQSLRSEHEISSSCRTNEDEESHGISNSCRTNEDEESHGINSSCRTNEEEDDNASSSERFDQEPIDQSERTHDGLEIVHLDNV